MTAIFYIYYNSNAEVNICSSRKTLQEVYEVKVRNITMACVLLVSVPFFALVSAQTPPHIEISKELEDTGTEICPGAILDVTIRLTGAGSTAFLREPVNAVSVIDKSGSMTWGGTVAYNEFLEPPYAPIGTPGYTSTGSSPYVETIWAAWKFYEYFCHHPPLAGEQDYSGLVWYGYAYGGSGRPWQYVVPGQYPVLTPTPIQRDPDPYSPLHKSYWWHSVLAREPVGGNTAMGPAMQVARNILGAMPEPERPNFMLMMSDGRPNEYWTPQPSENPPWSQTGTTTWRCYMHAIEIARRTSLSEPLNDAYGRVYPQVWDTTIYTLGLGSQVDTLLMNQLSDPWDPVYWGGIPRPENSHQGFFAWALTENDLIDTFEEIAGHIISNVAGSQIYVLEIIPSINGECPGGGNAFTEIIPNSWNYPPTVIPPDPDDPTQNYTYTWDFSELLIGDEIEITFQMMVTDDVPLDTAGLLIECPESEVNYTNYLGTPLAFEIIDPGFTTGLCDGPTATPTETPLPTATPTCIQETLMFDDFEMGDFVEWDGHGPDWGVKVFEDSNYAHDGDYFAYFAGCMDDPPDGYGPSEAHLIKFLDFSDPIKPGAVLECYIRLKGLAAPQKSGGGSKDGEPYDLFMIEITDENNNYTLDQLSFFDQTNKYFHYRKSLQQFAGSQYVRIRFFSYFPVTIYNPQPSSSEPMVFIDDLIVYDYCYEPTPTPTPTPAPPPPIPTTSPKGVGLTLLIIGILIGIPVLRKAL